MGSKISEILEPFVKARGFKISEILGAVGASKNRGDFWSRGPCLRNSFPRDLSLFGCLRCCSGERKDPDGEPKSFRIYRLAVSVHGDLCAPRGWMRGPRDPKSPDVSSHFSLFGCLRGGSRQARAEIQIF